MARRIFVSNDYKKPFEAVRNLIRAGALSDLPYEVHGEIIFDGTYEYVLSGKATDEDQHESHYFTDEGATWFRCLRGQSDQNDDELWYKFMLDVREEYHKRFSVVAYEQMPKNAAELEKARKEAAGIITRFAKLFCPELRMDVADVRTVQDEDTAEDIFGVSLRIELSAEATSGASLPLLCKVYFNKNKLETKPMTWQVAKQYDREIAGLIPDDERAIDLAPDGDPEILISNALDAMEKLIGNGNVNFSDYTWMGEIAMPDTDAEERAANLRDDNDPTLTDSERKQRKALRKLYIQMSHDNFALQCQHVDLLYISHVKAESYVCDLYVEGTPMLRIEMGINNALTVRCRNCDDDKLLVDRNEIFYELGGVKKAVALDPKLKNFGLDDKTIEEVRRHSNIRDHFIRKTCPNHCTSLKCRKQLFEVGRDVFCLDCVHPEVVYVDFDGKKYHTPSLLVATDTLHVYAANGGETPPVGRCTVCGRTVSTANLQRGKCKTLCAGLYDSGRDVAARRLYKTYRGVLPLGKRLFARHGSKRCYEDDELILFAVGSKKYIFNKLNVSDRGYLQKPQQIK